MTDYAYDVLNRRTVVTFPAVGQSARTTQMTGYDELGRRFAETNQDGIVTRFGYDALGRLLAVTNDWHVSGPNPFVTTYGYDEAGNLSRQTNANGKVTSFVYDKLGHRVQRTLPEGQSERSFYDAAGNLTIHTNFDGRITWLTYDVLNRLRKKIDPNASSGDFPLVEFTYKITGQREQMFDASTPVTYDYEGPENINVFRGAVSYEYDSLNRLQTKTMKNGGKQSVPPPVTPSPPSLTTVLHYEYDANGNVTRISTEDDFTDIYYDWDALNRFVELGVNWG